MAKMITPLIVGGGSASGAVEAGTVTLELVDGNLRVTYSLYDDYISNSSSSDSRDDWGLSEIHFDFGGTKGSLPVAKNGNPQVGKFDFGGKMVAFDPTNTSSQISFTVYGVSESDLTYWAAHAVVSQRPALQAFNESLPKQVSVTLSDGPDQDLGPVEDSYWEVTVSGSSESWLNQTFKAWCVDTTGTASETNFFAANLYSSVADDLTGIPVDKPLNFDRVNWLLNHADYFVGRTINDVVTYGGLVADSSDYVNGGTAAGYTEDLASTSSLGVITFGDIQRAIWGLIDNTQSTAGLGPYSLARADELADMAYIHGKGYVPECDDKVAVVFKPLAATGQIVIGQVTMAGSTYPCNGSSDTGWAITDGIAGLGGSGGFGSSWAEYNSWRSSLV